jgi:hypothetical protein
MLENFPKKSCSDLWEKFEKSCLMKESISSDQVFSELEQNEITQIDGIEWLKKNKAIFINPSPDEFVLLAEWNRKKIFNYCINANDIIRNIPISAPFSIVQAKKIGAEATLVIDYRSLHAKKIHQICKEEEIECIDYDDYLSRL